MSCAIANMTAVLSRDYVNHTFQFTKSLSMAGVTKSDRADVESVGPITWVHMAEVAGNGMLRRVSRPPGVKAHEGPSR